MDDEHADAGEREDATASRDYADRLVRLEAARWKQVIDVQAPYRWNIRRLRLGRTLDVGCGIGRNLHHLGADAVGVDHNADSVAVARSRGLTAYASDEFRDSPDAVHGSYDTLLLAHVVEHMKRDSAVGLLAGHLMFLRPAGRVVLITPQEAGYRSDSTHVRFVDFDGAADLAAAIGFEIERKYSFPFPRMAGKIFAYNEFVTVTRSSQG
jgi:2-polyprenyl-3-methyl-5-hydroxy-6-metoxy-1,4-benzoquinol methylase